MALRPFDVAPRERSSLRDYAEHLLAGERVEAGFRGETTTVLFTDRRIVTVQIQVVLNERIETTSISYRAVRQFALNRAADGGGRSEFRLMIEGDAPLHLRADPGTDFSLLQTLLAERLA
ncbi:MAG TPA: PH domain-containing protein [Allosphingosinicella sp.]